MTTHVEAEIEKYFDGRIEAIAERDALFGHLDRCDGCRRRFDELAVAHRALAGDQLTLPATELALIGRTVIQSTAKPVERPRSWLRILVPAAVFAAVLVFSLLPRGEFASKGGETAGAAAIDVLCFDALGEPTKALKADGSCPAPGLIKLVYASARPAAHLRVVALVDDTARIDVTLENVEPRSPIPGHAALAAGEKISIVVLARGEALEKRAPSITVTGVPR
jgi:hypothetical protein